MKYNLCRLASVVSKVHHPTNATSGGIVYHIQTGDVGEQLFQWASISNIAFQNGMTPCIYGGELGDLFTDINSSCEERLPWHCAREDVLDKGHILDLHHTDTVIIGPLRTYVDPATRQHAQFKPFLLSHAAAFLEPLQENVLVGIHVPSYDVSRIETPPMQYFKNAMDFFTHRYYNVGFVLVCEDRVWCSRQPHFQQKNVHLSPISRHSAVDMAILASCKSIIISTGSFGWWSAYLGPDSRRGGSVVYYKYGPAMGSVGGVKLTQGTDYYPSNWITVENGIEVQQRTTRAPSPTNGRLSIGDTTIVTSYFPFAAQPSNDNRIWMSNMLSLQDAMVVFTTHEYEEMIYSMRRHATNRTLVIVTRLQDALVVSKYGMDFWRMQLKLDDTPMTRTDPMIYITGNEKMSFVHQSITINPFISSHFLWMDIGTLQHTRYNDRCLVTDATMFYGDEVLMLDTTSMTSNFILDVFKENKNRVGSTVFGGTVDAMERYYAEYYKTLAINSDAAVFVGMEQPNMWQTCQRVGGLCRLVVPDAWLTRDDLWGYMVPFLLQELQMS
ncbi:hypothetical protein T484DRAFT_1756657 [Baffinella frigidus]|nr:hypothetical protein T484DRAFT_1756657 [Cryptophyta sp. CCMP2293]